MNAMYLHNVFYVGQISKYLLCMDEIFDVCIVYGSYSYDSMMNGEGTE